MRKNNPVWILAIITVFLLLILNIVMFWNISDYKKKIGSLNTDNAISFSKEETSEKCPDAEGGLNSAFLQIKYFYSDYCPWCRKEEPILQKLIKDYGNVVNIKWYNVDDCGELVNKYKINGVPTFVFNNIEDQREYIHYGFIYEKDLIKLMCDVTGSC